MSSSSNNGVPAWVFGPSDDEDFTDQPHSTEGQSASGDDSTARTSDDTLQTGEEERPLSMDDFSSSAATSSVSSQDSGSGLLHPGESGRSAASTSPDKDTFDATEDKYEFGQIDFAAFQTRIESKNRELKKQASAAGGWESLARKMILARRKARAEGSNSKVTSQTAQFTTAPQPKRCDETLADFSQVAGPLLRLIDPYGKDGAVVSAPEDKNEEGEEAEEERVVLN